MTVFYHTLHSGSHSFSTFFKTGLIWPVIKINKKGFNHLLIDYNHKLMYYHSCPVGDRLMEAWQPTASLTITEVPLTFIRSNVGEVSCQGHDSHECGMKATNSLLYLLSQSQPLYKIFPRNIGFLVHWHYFTSRV